LILTCSTKKLRTTITPKKTNTKKNKTRFKHSGIGAEGGEEGIREFLATRVVSLPKPVDRAEDGPA
jgi:hypothetical protein